MKRQGLRGVIRGKGVRTTVADTTAPCPRDRVNRPFTVSRPHPLRDADFTDVSTWQGWLYVAFVIDVFARCIVGWRVSRSLHTDCVLDALEQALYARQPGREATLIHHSDSGRPVRLDPLQRAPGRSRRRPLRGQPGRQL